MADDKTDAIIKTGGAILGNLLLQYDVPKDIKCWSAIISGNPYFYVYGYQTGVGVKYGRMKVDAGGYLLIDTEIGGRLYGAGTSLVLWDSTLMKFYDDKTIVIGAGSDVCMGYMNTGDIWHICDGGILGDNKRMSVNGTGLSFFGEAPVAQAGHIGDTGGDDAAVVNAILVVLEDLGLIADS